MNYFNLYPGDYMRDTADLSLTEHGAFLVLLLTYYSTEQPVPTEMANLNRICRAVTPDEQSAVAYIADRFFPVTRGERRNGRADREIAKAKPRIAAARSNGRKPKVKASGIASGLPNGSQNEVQYHSHRDIQQVSHAGVGVGVGLGVQEHDSSKSSNGLGERP